MQEQISTTLNGQPETFQAPLESSALELIREQAGLTGTKLVCGSGACGACTILVDGEARCACIMPATQLEGKQVLTVEAHDKDGLHPVQKAFLAHDGLQCGYCTPGFINEGIAFYNRWRAANGKKRPAREEIADAMAGHLCRCGAYVGIYAAIQSACAGDFDGPEIPDYARVDGIPKVTGAAKYTTDIQLPGQLVGMILRSPHPHARIKRIDLGKAQAAPGVKAVIQVNQDNVVRFEGQPIAALAAETQAQAHAALKLIEVEFEPLPFVIDPKLARQADAPLVYPPDTKVDIPVASEGPAFPGSWTNNVRKTSLSLSSSEKGKAERMVKQSTLKPETRFSAIFHTPTQFHSCFEPHCAVADWQGDGKLRLFLSTQAVYWIAGEVAKHYKLKEENVRVIAHYIGGAFGSKLAMHTEILTSIDLSMAAGKPVALIFSRAEEMTEAGFRPSAEIEVTITADVNGQNAAYQMEAYANSGIAIGSNVADVSGLGYTGISKALQDYDVVTNFQPGSAFRAPGGPAACFALEQSIDQLAEQLGMNPIAFRKQWETNEGYLALFKWVESLPLWKGRAATGTQQGRFQKGVGVAFGGWMHLYMPSAEVEVEADSKGLIVRNAVQDMGQGAKSVLAKAVADVFGIPANQIRVEAGESQLNIGPASGGSRTAASIYPAAREAAEKLQTSLLFAVTKSMSLQNATIRPGGVNHQGGFLPWKEVFANITSVKEKATRGRNAGFNPMGMVPLAQGLVLGQNRSYGAYVIEVEVDTLLGKVRVTDVQGAMRVGRIHVRPNAESQCYGGVIQGIGHVLYEDRGICPTSGRILSRGLEDYRLPGIGDIPPIHIDFIEEGFEFVKQGGIGLAELCTIPVAGAIANAIYNATGWRPLSAPIRPENVLAGLKKA